MGQNQSTGQAKSSEANAVEVKLTKVFMNADLTRAILQVSLLLGSDVVVRRVKIKSIDNACEEVIINAGNEIIHLGNTSNVGTNNSWRHFAGEEIMMPLTASTFHVTMEPVSGPVKVFPNIQASNEASEAIYNDMYKAEYINNAAIIFLISGEENEELREYLEYLDTLTKAYKSDFPGLVPELQKGRLENLDDPNVFVRVMESIKKLCDDVETQLLNSHLDPVQRVPYITVTRHALFIAGAVVLSAAAVGGGAAIGVAVAGAGAAAGASAAVSAAVAAEAGAAVGAEAGVAAGAAAGLGIEAAAVIGAGAGTTLLTGTLVHLLGGKEDRMVKMVMADLKYRERLMDALKFIQPEKDFKGMNSRPMEDEFIMTVMKLGEDQRELSEIPFREAIEAATTMVNKNKFRLIGSSQEKMKLFVHAVIAVSFIRRFLFRNRLIGVLGSTNAGKTTLASEILRSFDQEELAARIPTGDFIHTRRIGAYPISDEDGFQAILLDYPGIDDARASQVTRFIPYLDIAIILGKAKDDVPATTMVYLRFVRDMHPTKKILLLNQADLLSPDDLEVLDQRREATIGNINATEHLIDAEDVHFAAINPHPALRQGIQGNAEVKNLERVVAMIREMCTASNEMP